MADYSYTQGDKRTIRLDWRTGTWDDTTEKWGAWTDASPSSATVFVLEADEKSEGSVDSATASTVVDATFDEADNFWNGVTLEFVSGTNEGEKREVSDFTSTSGTFTLNVLNNALPATPSAGDDFVLHGYPVVPVTDLDGHDHGSLTNEQLTFQVRPDDGASSTNGVTATPGLKFIIFTVTWTGGGNTEEEEHRCTIDVRPST